MYQMVSGKCPVLRKLIGCKNSTLTKRTKGASCMLKLSHQRPCLIQPQAVLMPVLCKLVLWLVKATHFSNGTHQVHVLQSAHVAKYIHCKVHMLQSACVAKCMCCKVHILQSACAAKCMYCKVHMLQSACIAKWYVLQNARNL